MKHKKKGIKTLCALLILTIMAAFAHYLIFPQETRSLFIQSSTFRKEGNLYVSPTTPQGKIDTLQSLIQQASDRVATFWGQKISDPDFIYCYTTADFKKYGSSMDVPARTFLKIGSHIVLSNDGADLDIIAHEISHAELYEQIGFYKWTFTDPSWFKQGLAMQNDYRSYYSDDTLKAKSNGFRNLPDIKLFKTDAQFYAGTLEQVMLSYMAAKHEVKNWYTKEKLYKLIKDLNAGKPFTEAYGK